MKRHYLFLLISLFACSVLVNAQGKINLLNGKIFEFDSIGKTANNKFNYVSHGTKKPSSIKASRIFSINYSSGKEEVVYVPDTSNFDLTIPQMKSYVSGEQYSRQHYKAPWVTVGGILAGGCGGYFGLFYGPIVPAIYGTVVTTFTPNLNKAPYNDVAFDNEYYAYGFDTTCRKKKLKNALLGGGIGFAISVTTFIILSRIH